MRKQNHSSTCDVNAWKWRVRERALGELWPSGQQRHTSFRSEGTVQWCFLTSRITCDPPVLGLTPWVWLMPPKLGLGGTASCNCASSTVTARAEQTPGGALCTNGGGWSCDSSYAEYLELGTLLPLTSPDTRQDILPSQPQSRLPAPPARPPALCKCSQAFHHAHQKEF